jgi:transcriptional regulator with AAA-type ATPase domain
MNLIENKERKTFELLLKLGYTNPFSEERMNLEGEILGLPKSKQSRVWHIGLDETRSRPEVIAIAEKTKQHLDIWHRRLRSGIYGSEQERDTYIDLVLFHLYDLLSPRFVELILADHKTRMILEETIFNEFKEQFTYWSEPTPEGTPKIADLAHLFALFYQARRAFHYIYSYISGESQVIANLRVQLWQSVFTHDLKRFRKSLYKKMGDFATLITGPSGTGKELVARAIGNSRYIPFDLSTKSFKDDHHSCFLPLNLSALSATLIESELFGHRKGAFTGALQDRKGYLEQCQPWGTVFLDEIGELSEITQVKLLRVFQTRTFQKVGDNKEVSFQGKLVAATNRDLAHEMSEGNFREDFYYRLCADQIETPSLHSILSDTPEDLDGMVGFIVDRIVAPHERESTIDEVLSWIKSNLPKDYSWPGNFRELEQCVRGILIRQHYQPRLSRKLSKGNVWSQMEAGQLSLDQVISFYCRHVHQFTNSLSNSAKQLQVDRRTLQSRMSEHSEIK